MKIKPLINLYGRLAGFKYNLSSNNDFILLHLEINKFNKKKFKTDLYDHPVHHLD